LFPLTLVDEFPFTICELGSMVYLEEGRFLNYYYDDRTRLRARPLSPLLNPVEAAEHLTESERWRDLELSPAQDVWKRAVIRRQALKALASLFRLSPDDCPGGIFGPSENRWTEIIREIRQLALRWDPEGQKFVRLQ